MNQSNHREYYVARAAASRDLAQRATDPAAAAIHAELAARYELLAAQPEPTNDVMMQRVQAA